MKEIFIELSLSIDQETEYSLFVYGDFDYKWIYYMRRLKNKTYHSQLKMWEVPFYYKESYKELKKDLKELGFNVKLKKD